MTRVYLPLTVSGLAELEASGVCGPAPLRAHAVTDAVVEALADSDDEEREYAALTVAAQHAVALLGPSDPDRRVVVALDVAAVEDLRDPDDPTAVSIAHEVPRRKVGAVLVDTEDAGPAVAAARAAHGTPAYDELLERCLDHELAWYGAQEIGALLDR